MHTHQSQTSSLLQLHRYLYGHLAQSMLHLNKTPLSIIPVLSAIGESSGLSHKVKTEHQCMQPNNAKNKNI